MMEAGPGTVPDGPYPEPPDLRCKVCGDQIDAFSVDIGSLIPVAVPALDRRVRRTNLPCGHVAGSVMAPSEPN